MKSFKIRKKIYKNKKYTKRKNIKTKKANTRRKKYNKKTFNKKSFNKKTFRKKSYNKKTLRKKSYRKTFNKKKFRNLKGGVRFWKKRVPPSEVPPSEIPPSEIPPSQVSSPEVVTFVHNGPYTPDNTLLHVEPITWSRSFSMPNKKTRELPPGYLITTKPYIYQKMKQLIDKLRETTLSKKELIKKRDNKDSEIVKYKQGIASDNSYLEHIYPNYDNEVQNSIYQYEKLIIDSLNDIKRIDLAIQKIKDQESSINHKLHKYKDMYQEFKDKNNVDA